MVKVGRPTLQNRLIAGLPQAERESLLYNCADVELNFGDRLCSQHEPYSYAYFPLTAIISLMASVEGHPPMEVSIIGHEGMLGVTLLLASDLAPQHAIVQGSGMALRISVSDLCEALVESPVLRHSMRRYCFGLMAELGQTTVCTRFHQVEARLARWLLMTHDRAHADHFYLTHEFLSDMLGVQRSAVTIASGVLKQGKLIGYSRGRISILDRAGLEAVACECYMAA
ncbi:MAG: Crp/Fnr family transcriptional regulator [Gammaproteobacteria bacterium]|nr:Crp/Fnr family transcriptional regulator [Gammaproteobacteria bacterium]